MVPSAGKMQVVALGVLTRLLVFVDIYCQAFMDFQIYADTLNGNTSYPTMQHLLDMM